MTPRGTGSQSRRSSRAASPRQGLGSDATSEQVRVLEELRPDAAEAFGVDLLSQAATPAAQYYRDRHSYVVAVDREEERIQS